MNLNHRPYILLIAAFLLCHNGSLLGQTGTVEDRLLISDPQDLLDLEKKDHLRTSTTDLQSRDVREAPANIQVITARQIEASRARDLFEVLQMVPGLGFGTADHDGMTVGVHGTWGNESRFLFLLNGDRLNDNDLGGYAIGARIPIDNIERIEVILGPGPLTHDSQSLLGSINIITRSADHGSGAVAVIRTGVSHGNTTRSSATISGSQRLNSDQEISYLASSLRGRRSNFNGALSFIDSTAIEVSAFQLQYRWRTLKAFMVFMNEDHQVFHGDHGVQRKDLIAGLKQRIMLGKGLELNWKITHSDQLPGNRINTLDLDGYKPNTAHQRVTGSAMLGYKPTAWSTIRLGLRSFHQRSEFLVRDSSSVFKINGDQELSMTAVSAFLEVNATGKFGSLTAGYKVDRIDLLGEAIAPRIAYTKVLGRFHAKAMLSKSFGMPSIMILESVATGTPIAPEYAITHEGELGFRAGNSTLVTLNAYQNTIEDPLHRMILADQEFHVRAADMGTEGIDLRITSEANKFTLSGGFGFHRPLAAGISGADQLTDRSGMILLPTQRATLFVAWNATPSITLRTRGSWRSAIHTHVPSDLLAPIASDPELLMNGGIAIRPKASERFSIDLGCNNILDVERPLPSITNSVREPFMLNGREFTLALTYRFVQ